MPVLDRGLLCGSDNVKKHEGKIQNISTECYLEINKKRRTIGNETGLFGRTETHRFSSEHDCLDDLGQDSLGTSQRFSYDTATRNL